MGTVRIMLMALVLAPLAGCGEPDENFTRVQGTIVAVEEECELDARESVQRSQNGQTRTSTKSVSREGTCGYIQGLARRPEYRSVEIRRELDLSYEYTSPVDNQIHRGTAEREQRLEHPIPQVGDRIEILAHRTEAQTSRLP